MKFSLKYRIAVMIFLLEAVMMAVVLWQTLGYSLQSSREQLATTEQTIMELVKHISRVALLTEEYAELQPYLEDLRNNPRVIRAVLADAEGRVVASTHSIDVGRSLAEAMARKDSEQHFWRSESISNAAGPLGELAISFSNEALLAAYTRARNLGITIAITGMVVIAIAGLLAGFLLTRRLEQITEAARRFAGGEEDVQAPVQGDDELGELARSFNDMASSARERQKQLQESERYNRMLFEQSAIGLALCRMNGEFIDINAAYARIIGRTVEETLSMSYWDITPERYAADEAEQLERLKKTGRYGPYEKEYMHKDGHMINVLLHGQLIERDGETYIWSSVEDITERKQTEEALRRSQKMEAIGQLSGGIAHDFNNQLGVVIGYLDFLGDYTANDDKAHQWVQTASRATLRCMDLTRQLLAFSRRQGQEKRVVNLNELVSELETMIARSVTPEVDVQYFLANNLWATEINDGEFQDVILNLVINARDAMPHGGKLLIETSNKFLDEDYTALNPEVSAGDYVQLMLSDTGSGMDRETLEHVFEPFFTTKPEGKGTGLGLAMVYGFVKRYGGYIKIYSEPGVGTTIRIYLPRSKNSKEVVSVPDLPVSELPRGNENILIVDDETDLLKLASQYLQEQGYHTLVARHAGQALELLEQNPDIDLLFSDVVMPGGMNGYELAREATRLRPGLRVLLTSGFTSRTIAHNGLARFSANLLDKPYRRDDLLRRIRLVLDQSQEQASTTSSSSLMSLDGKTILVLDDEADVLELFQINLQRLGCKVLSAGNCEQAVAIYRNAVENGQTIDAVILDLTLPGELGGKDVADRIRAINPRARIIVASGDTEGPEMTNYRDFGFNGAMEKHFERDVMRRVLQDVLSQP